MLLSILSSHALRQSGSVPARPRFMKVASNLHPFKANFSKTAPDSQRRWTSAEVEMLQDYRAQGLRLADIASRLGRLESSVASKSRRLIKSPNDTYFQKRFTAAEDDMLREMKPCKSNLAHLRKEMPHRSHRALSMRASTLRNGAKPNTWTSYVKYVPWTDEEERLLLNLREQKSLKFDEMLDYFPQRNLSALITKYKRLRVRPSSTSGVPIYKQWTESDDATLKAMKAEGASTSAIAATLSRSRTSIVSRAYDLRRESGGGVKMMLRPLPWSEDEINMVKTLRAQSKTAGEISALLPGRTSRAVQTLCYDRKISRPGKA